MAKRLQVNFHKPGPTMVAEDGQPRPCARGVGWVNEHTLQTLEKVGVPRTDAKGNVLPESVQRDTSGGLAGRGSNSTKAGAQGR
jgi:hypothetical protein